MERSVFSDVNFGIDNDCKVIISSGLTKDQSLDEMRRLGLAGFLRKPFSDYDLSILLTEILLQRHP